MTHPTELRYRQRFYKRTKRYRHIVTNVKAGRHPKVEYKLVKR